MFEFIYKTETKDYIPPLTWFMVMIMYGDMDVTVCPA
jgi:hypothetical protein